MSIRIYVFPRGTYRFFTGLVLLAAWCQAVGWCRISGAVVSLYHFLANPFRATDRELAWRGEP